MNIDTRPVAKDMSLCTEEIDIQSIEEIKDIFIENSTCGEDVKYLARKYNEILKWAKQLDKKIIETQKQINESLKSSKKDLKLQLSTVIPNEILLQRIIKKNLGEKIK